MGNMALMRERDRTWEEVAASAVERLYSDIKNNREDITKNEDRQREDIKELKTRLFGNGQPGELTRMRDEIDELKSALNKSKGALWVMGSLTTISIAVNFFVQMKGK